MGRSAGRSGFARRGNVPFPPSRFKVLAALAAMLPANLIPATASAGNLLLLSPPPAADDASTGETPRETQKTTVREDALTAQGKSDSLTAGVEPAALPRPPAGLPSDPALADATETPYYLEVFINGQPTHLIGEFRRLPDGGFACRAKELRELGLRPPEGVADDDLVKLADLGARTEYDETAQRILITVDDAHRLRKVYDLKRGLGRRVVDEVSRKDTGLVVNYSLLTSARTDNAFASSSFEGASANLESWIFSPVGTFSGSGFLRYDEFRNVEAVRLDTAWQFTDLKRSITYRIGDLIASGPNWARPVRMGGGQISRNFAVRPDLLTTPLPSLSGTAAVPTTVDVYLNNVKVHTQEVEPGPFTITNIPAISSSGVARLVMRDASGREIEVKKSFYTSSSLLRAGYLEFSASAGLPRLSYGEKSFDYVHTPGGTLSARYGISDRLTVHGHAEASRDLLLFGGGITGVLFDKVLATAAGAFSHSDLGTGYLAYGELETRLGNFSLKASAQHIFGDYTDLAGISAAATGAGGLSQGIYTSGDFPRAVDMISVGYALPDISGGISANFLHTEKADGEITNTLALNYNQRILDDISFYATAFADVRKLDRPSVFVGVTIPLGGARGTVSTGASYDEQGRYRATVSYSKPLKQKNNSFGWRARATYGDLKSAQASLAWRSSKGTVRGTVMHLEDNTLGYVSADGAVIVAGGGVFATNRIYDSFAIVDAGAPGVTVRYENRPIGRTGRDGRLLIPTLRSFDRNKISIDPETLPVDARVPTDKKYVVPADRSGVVVDFGVKAHSDSALVTFVDPSGRPLEVGSEVRLRGGGEATLVGYDGQAFLEGLSDSNTVRITTPSATCEATFAFRPKPGEQVRIGPVTCTPVEDAAAAGDDGEAS